MTCTSWRGVEARIDWMLDHPPGVPGYCAREVWQALGGDQATPCPPAWGCDNANEVYDKVLASGRFWRTTPIPRGAVIVWRYGAHGHAALSWGDGQIVTTDPEGWSGGVGVEDLDYPHRWGANSQDRIWTDQYNSVRFTVGEEMPDVVDYDYLDKPSGTQTIGRSYETLDQSSWNPPRTGLEHTLVYLNVTPTFRDGKTIGALRIRVLRENGDAHAPDTIPILADALDDDGVATIQYQTFEWGGAGDSTKIQVKCIGGLESAKIGTRYTSKAVVVG